MTSLVRRSSFRGGTAPGSVDSHSSTAIESVQLSQQEMITLLADLVMKSVYEEEEQSGLAGLVLFSCTCLSSSMRFLSAWNVNRPNQVQVHVGGHAFRVDKSERSVKLRDPKNQSNFVSLDVPEVETDEEYDEDTVMNVDPSGGGGLTARESVASG